MLHESEITLHGCSAHVTKPKGTKRPGPVMTSTGGTFRSGPGISLHPRNHPLDALNAFQKPPSTAWLFLRNHLLGFSKSVLLLSYIAVQCFTLSFFKWLEQQAFCYSPWETKSQANQQPARASSMALISLSLISLKMDLIFCMSLNKK